MWRCLWVPKIFLVILLEKWWRKWWYGGASKRVWRSEEKLPDGEMKKKKMKEMRRKEPVKVIRENSKKEWWVVGLGRAWHVGNQNMTLTFYIFLLFFNANWDVTHGSWQDWKSVFANRIVLPDSAWENKRLLLGNSFESWSREEGCFEEECVAWEKATSWLGQGILFQVLGWSTEISVKIGTSVNVEF